MELKRVVVTGLGAITPLGNSVNTYWEGLKEGRSGAGPITLFDSSRFKVNFACEVKDYDPMAYFDRKEARKVDRFSQFGIIASDEAIKDSGLLESGADRDYIGVIFGSGIGGIRTMEEQISAYALGDGTPRYSPFFVPKMIVDITPGHISIKHGLRGINFATVSACASATHAMIDAYNYIRLGKAIAIVSGGSEAGVSEASLGGFSSMKALSMNNDNPTKASRPFDRLRDGFVMGEGGAALILEEYEHAKARGAKIYAEIVGGGMTADAHHITAPHPEGLGARNVMRFALEDAELNKEDIDYINVHGTSTPLGDIAESLAIKSVFGESAYDLNISSTKSMTGHLLGAAGAIESVACIKAVSENIIPPTINHEEEDPELDSKLNFTFNTAQERTVNYALCNTFGFGGHNASVVVKKFTD